ncbi:hypothetical protein ZWY2020_033227, partial [Hordeum vulgare]
MAVGPRHPPSVDISHALLPHGSAAPLATRRRPPPRPGGDDKSGRREEKYPKLNRSTKLRYQLEVTSSLLRHK